jgi:hypothetical protein
MTRPIRFNPYSHAAGRCDKPGLPASCWNSETMKTLVAITVMALILGGCAVYDTPSGQLIGPLPPVTAAAPATAAVVVPQAQASSEPASGVVAAAAPPAPAVAVAPAPVVVAPTVVQSPYVWVPGHYGAYGQWIIGHWRYY